MGGIVWALLFLNCLGKLYYQARIGALLGQTWSQVSVTQARKGSINHPPTAGLQTWIK
ncbi:hypothetical protein DSO57_1017291, partial [Entomophthora muscae]